MNPWLEDRPRYIVRRGDEEVAFLAFDLCCPDILMYEIFIRQGYRGQGIGSLLIKEAADVGREYGCTRLLVRPEELLSEYPVNKLTDWYQKRGFAEVSDNPGLLQLAIGVP